MCTKRKNARPEAATSERAKRESTRQSGNSQNQFIITGNGGQVGVSSFLMSGCENGLHLSELVQLTGWTEREIRRVIQQERKAGKLILSDNKSGYFLPASEHEVRRFIRSMSNRSREIADVSRAAEDALSRMTGQRLIEGWGNG